MAGKRCPKTPTAKLPRCSKGTVVGVSKDSVGNIYGLNSEPRSELISPEQIVALLTKAQIQCMHCMYAYLPVNRAFTQILFNNRHVIGFHFFQTTGLWPFGV